MNILKFIKKKKYKYNDTILISGFGDTVIVGKNNKVSGFYNYRKEK